MATGQKQTLKASSNTNMPDAGLRHGGSISMPLSMEKSKRTTAPGQESREMELHVTPPTRRSARFSPVQEIPPLLGFQQQLPQHPQNKDCFGWAKFNLFFLQRKLGLWI